jgi:aldose 1-epimerase
MKKICCSILLFVFIYSAACNSAETDKEKTAIVQSIVPTEISLPDLAGFDSVVNGKKTSLFYLTNKNNLKAAITNYGARMVSLLLPDRIGKPKDIILGFNSLSGYMNSGEKYYGAIVGRYGNRIAMGKFKLDGKSYQLDINNSPNSLHGGSTGFHSRIWDAVRRLH